MKIKNLRMNQVWAAPLIFLGLGSAFGIFDFLFRTLVKATENIDIRQYHTPRLDQYTAQEPVFGAILLVGGLLLWFMPAKDT